MGKPTELMQLLKTGNSDAARKLITKMKKSGKKKALAKELNTPDESGAGQTVIHYCAAQNFVEFLHDLADLGATIDIVDSRGLTPLHLAAGSGRTSAVSALLGRGADANVASPNGDTPLHFACQGGHTATVEALIAEHANCTMLNVSGHTPLDLASQNGHANAVGALLRSGQFPQSFLQRSDMPHTALLLAAKSGHNEVISILIKHGFDINRKLPGANGNCLHEAALYGKVETVKYLLQCGADITSVNNQGHTALDIVNMYTDPRSAGQMKQVLQDALAQHARVKIHQQHQQQQLQQLHQQKQPQYHHPQQAQPAHHAQQQSHSYQRQPSRDSGQYQQHHPSHQQQQPQRQGAPPQPSAAPGQSSPSRMHQGGGFSYLMPGAGKPPSPRMQAGGQHRQPQQQQQPAPPTSAAQQQQYHHHHQQQQHVEQKPRAGSYPTPSQPGQAGQGYQHHQPHLHQHQQQQQHQLQGAAYQQQRQEQMRQYQVHSQQSASSSYQQQRQNSFPLQQQPPPPTSSSGGGYQQQQSYPGPPHQQQQQQQQQGTAQHYHHQHQQHHQQQGSTHTPDASRRSGGPVLGGPPSDLAAMIAAKAASRKPMTTSPTRKDFPSSGGSGGGGPMEHDARLIRSSTMGRDGSISDARHSALRRRNSLTDQHVTSPEPYDHSNPPTLPRRTNVGPPQFKPPPPGEGTLPQPPSLAQQNRLSNVSNRSDEGAIDVEPERPKLRKIQPKPPPEEPSMDNELLKKLQRRQNRIQKAEEQGVESLEPHLNPRELQDEESPKHEAATAATEQATATPPVQQKPKVSAGGPPPIPERKTATLTTQPSVSSSEPPPPPPPSQPPPPSSQPPPPSTQPAAPPAEVNKAPPPKAKPKAKPPPPKPKEEEPGLSPWQAELQKRKQKRAEEAEVAAQAMMTEQQEEKAEPTAEEKQRTPPPGPPPVVSKKPPKPTPAGRERASSDAPPPAPPTQPPPPPVTQAPPPEPVVAPPTPEPVVPPPPVDKPAEEVKLKPETTPTAPPNSTPSGDSQLSRSTSLSSLATGSTAPMLPVTEPIPIGDWLSSYKLGDYAHLFEASGYDRTDFLLSLTSDELVEIGVQKPGHKKKIMSAVSSLIHKEHLIATKPASVPDWLVLLNLSQYEQVLMEAGYDDIDFVSDITTEELQDIGITKKGHLKRFMRGIAELLEVSPATPTAADAPIVQNGKEQVDLAAELTKALPPSDLKMPSPEADILPPPPPPLAASYTQPEENGLKDAVSVESIEAPPPKAKPKPASRSPSHSPQTQRRVVQPPPPSTQGGGGAPPPPRRAPQTALSAAPDSLGAQNRYSYSSSTSSLSSGYSERVAGSMDVPLATQQQASAAAAGVAESPPRIPAKKKPSPSRRTMAPEKVPLRDEPDGSNLPPPGAELSAKKKTYSVEDITAALDEIIVQDEYLRDNGTGEDDNILPPPVEYGEDVGVPVGGAPNKSARDAADEGLDALSKALQGFSVEGGGQGAEEEAGEPDQLLADIDDMLADLNTHLDFMIPGEDGGTDV